jgi:hypothetical protein
LWVIGVTIVSISPIKEEFVGASSTRWIHDHGYKSDLPFICSSDIRGVLGQDYRMDEQTNLCWYEMDRFRVLYPEYKDLSEQVLENDVYRKAGIPLREFKPWRKLGVQLAWALLIPLAAFLLVWSMMWAFSGFREPDPGA